MKMNTFSDYSLRVLIYLALKQEEKTTVNEIATHYDISQNHLVKVVHNLSKRGLVESKKGRGGGLFLGQNPDSIVIGKLLESLEEGTPLAECFGQSSNCKIGASCKLKGALIRAKKSFYETLNEYTLADIVSNEAPLKKALQITS
jgi:Rrf2 family nitric oxide-sensitive transcriptional repressor